MEELQEWTHGGGKTGRRDILRNIFESLLRLVGPAPDVLPRDLQCFFAHCWSQWPSRCAGEREVSACTALLERYAAKEGEVPSYVVWRGKAFAVGAAVPAGTASKSMRKHQG